jgi:hypothetical protein
MSQAVSKYPLLVSYLLVSVPAVNVQRELGDGDGALTLFFFFFLLLL